MAGIAPGHPRSARIRPYHVARRLRLRVPIPYPQRRSSTTQEIDDEHRRSARGRQSMVRPAA
ncbi:MAG: hypothetical protein AAF772_07485, partial [Acidobacteriota bacterium]